MSKAKATGGTGAARTRVLKVDELARVEGEGALYVRLKGETIEDIRFSIHEPPRFFEALLKGRMYSDAPDITARICGICPIAYIMGASQAMEDALGVRVEGPLRDLRRAVYCGEWIESHVLHAFLLHAPDFLGLPDSIVLAKTHPDVVKKALALKKLGNEILEVLGGGRAIHPVNLKVGGFYKLPDKRAVADLVEKLRWGIETSAELARVAASFTFPDWDYDYTCVSLRHPDEYPICEGNIISNRGLDVPVAEFIDHMDEEHVRHSNALRGVMGSSAGGAYLTGPIARYNNCFDQLSDGAKSLAEEAGLGRVVTNPFRSILVRMVETYFAFEEAVRILSGYDPAGLEPSVAIAPKAGTGAACTEAPRGICWHGYSLDEEGRITRARIMPPTSQNQRQIEIDLKGVVERNMALADEDLKWLCEQAIRNYDPCISCATHFLKLTVDRG